MVEAPPAVAGLRFRPAVERDLPEILALLESGLGSSATRLRTEALWRWKHVDQPFGSSIVLVAESGSKIVGLRAFMRWQFQLQKDTGPGRVWKAVRAVDTVTHPAYRHRGVFASLNRTALAVARDQGVDFVFNTPNEESRSGYLKQGWRDVGRVGLVVRPVRPLRFLFAGVRYLSGRGRVAGDQWRPCGLEAIGSGDDDLFAALTLREAGSQAGCLETVAGPDYYAWRYGRHPQIEYYRLPARVSTAPFVVRPNLRFGARELVLCQAPPGGFDGKESSSALSRLRESGATYLIAVRGSAGPGRRVSNARGFFRARGAGIRLLVHPISERACRESLTDLERWSFALGDLEVF